MQGTVKASPSTVTNKNMTEDYKQDEIIELYLTGEFQGEELQAFKERLSADAEFRNQVALQRAIAHNIRVIGRKEWTAKLESIHQEISGAAQETVQVKQLMARPGVQKKFFLSMAAALILVAFSAIFLITRRERGGPEKIFISYFKPYPSVEQDTRQLAEDIPAIRKEAFRAYNNGDYPASIQLFKSILAKEEDELVLFYLGNAYLSVDDVREAAVIFQRYLNRYREFASEAKWYLSLSQLKQGKTEEAKKLLEELAGQRNDYQDEAKEILNRW
jgi:TolA-binding protein